jgi:hypothetical protein
MPGIYRSRNPLHTLLYLFGYNDGDPNMELLYPTTWLLYCYYLAKCFLVIATDMEHNVDDNKSCKPSQLCGVGFRSVKTPMPVVKSSCNPARKLAASMKQANHHELVAVLRLVTGGRPPCSPQMSWASLQHSTGEAGFYTASRGICRLKGNPISSRLQDNHYLLLFHPLSCSTKPWEDNDYCNLPPCITYAGEPSNG